MSANPVSHSPPVTDPEHSRADRALSIAATGLAWAVLFATYFLISPIQHATYPGHKPWRPGSMLHQITDAMALGNVLETFRGVEIKSLALFAACTVAFALLATRFALRRHEIHFARHARQSWFHAQTLWFLWIALSFFSAYWSVSPDIAIGQSTIYALQFGLAVGFGWLIRHRDFPRVETALLVIPSLGAALCIWYYFERNSLHRPGFPIGNPSTLAACTAPAIAIAVVRVWRWCHDGLVGKRRRPAGAAVLALVMLIPLVWCIRLTWSRAAIVSLVVGLVTLIFLQLRSRFRWVFVGVCSAGVIGALFWYALISSQDASNIRGATLRYRYYTWRYAAEMWQSRPGSGIGAGAFPQFAGERAATDRALDPGAFLGETITHAHNELFEIFAEIGLVGGVTWVGGVIATVFAALGVIRRRGPQHDDSWRALALLLAFVVIMTDAMFGVSLRLPGVPALLALVVGMIWAHAKAGNAENPESILDVIDSRAQPATYRTALISLGCAIACGASGWVSVRYARSAAAEAAAAVALRNDDFEAAIRTAEKIGPGILEPVAQLRARDTLMRAKSAVAQQNLADTRDPRPGSAELPGPVKADVDAAARSAQAAFEEAKNLLMIAPGWYRVGAYVASAAEAMAELSERANIDDPVRWRRRAVEAWLLQRNWLPYDFETLLALQQYPMPVAERLRWLRDAMRAEFFDRTRWRAALIALREHPEFDAVIAGLRRSIGPLTPATDRDLLVARLAPESHRLLADIAFLDGDYATAAREASEAEKLYEPMRSRFPLLRSRALAEQAEYLYLANPENAAHCAELIARAIDLLPDVQAELFDSIARPYRELRIHFLIAARAPIAQIEEILRKTLVRSPADEGTWRWLALLALESRQPERVDRVLAEAEEAGVEETSTAAIRAELQQLQNSGRP